MARVRVIGCGNPDAGDDAVGLMALRAARTRLPPSVDVVEAGPALQVLHLLDDVDDVIVIDAVRAPGGDRAPGTLVRAVAGSDGSPADLRSSLSSHGLGLAEAVGLAAVLGAVPRVVFLGVEVADVTAGAALSPPVQAALASLVDAVVAEATVAAT